MQKQNKYTDSFGLSSLFKKHFRAITLLHNVGITAGNEAQLRKKITAKYPKKKFEPQKVYSCIYYPLDIQKIYLDKEILAKESQDYVANFEKPNLGLLLPESFQLSSNDPFFITDSFHLLHPDFPNTAINFPLYEYFGKDLFHKKINLDMDLIQEISLRIALEFLPEDPGKGNVCFIQNPDVRDDFKTFYTPTHVLDYISAILHTKKYTYEKNTIWIPYPKENNFWQYVDQGKKLRQSHLMQKKEV